MALTPYEKDELRAYVLERTCAEYRNGEPCVARAPGTEMIGDKHAGCLKAERMLGLVERA